MVSRDLFQGKLTGTTRILQMNSSDDKPTDWIASLKRDDHTMPEDRVRKDQCCE